MRTPKLAAATLLGATALASVAMVEPTDAASVDVSNLSVGANDGNLLVAGTLDFGGRMEAGTDKSDVNAEGRVPGTNLVSAGVVQEGFTVHFDLDIDNMAPADPYSAPEVLQYGWDLIDGNGGPVSLSSFRTAAFQAALGATEPGEGYFSINTCSPDPDTGQSTCTGTDIGGAYSAEGVRWSAPMHLLGSQGATISLTGENPAHVTLGAAGAVWLNPGSPVDGDDMTTLGNFVIGGKVTVTVSDASGAVVAAKSLDLFQPDDSSATIDVSSLEAGEYTVTATSRYADQSDSDTTTITLG